MKPKIHFIATELMNAMNPITVNLFGAGGTGSHLLTCLARINFAMQATGKAGLQVRVFDADRIEQPNIGRANFNENYIGKNKAVAVVSHINRAYGLNWKAVPEHFIYADGDSLANLNICCVDSVKARKEMISGVHGMLKGLRHKHRDAPTYIMDFGNGKDCGQVLLSTVAKIPQPVSERFETVQVLPGLFEEFPEMEKLEDADAPSCSMFEALSKQSLFINSVLANLGSALIYQMLNEGMVINRGFFLNLETLRTEPIRV